MKHKNNLPRIFTGVKCIVFVLVLVAGLALNAIPSLRPTTSAAENRNLNEFPSFSWEKLASGTFFSHASDDPKDVGVSEWFADTFPFREALATAHKSYETLYGIQTTRIHGDVGPADDIPDAPMSREQTSSETASEPISSETASELPVSSEARVPTPETIGGVLVVDDAAYEYYNFNTTAANTYIDAINAAAQRLEGKAKVYDMIVPTAIGVTLPDELKDTVNSSDQQKAIHYMYTSMSDQVVKVDVYSALRTVRDEYIYFRSDHHWTPLGAYYAYRKLMASLKQTPVELADLYGKFGQVFTFDGFLGTLYSATKSAALAEHPDTVTAFLPNDRAMTMFYADGASVKQENYPIIRDPSELGASSKYWYTFIGGDHALGCLYNTKYDPAERAPRVCVLVKESYGNCFAPLLSANYDYVYVVDYRYLECGLVDLVERANATEVIFLNNISATRNQNLMRDLSELVNR